MKLLVKTSLYYLIFSVPILILSGFVCYYLITNEARVSNNDILLNRKQVIEDYLKNNDTTALFLINKSGEAQITKITLSQYNNRQKTVFKDTLVFDKREKELAINRMILATTKIHARPYQIKIWTSTLEFNELLEGIFYSLSLVLFFLFVTTLLINIWISKTLWRTFNSTLIALKTFSVSENKIALLEKTTITEFKALNTSLETMMQKMITDYNSQKKFTENASHEMQTPLAVIKSKVDLLIQSQKLNENDFKLIIAIDNACSKIIKLNKSLLLLTKIENRQFNDTELVSFEKTINDSLTFFQEHIEASNIEIIKKYEADFCIQINPDLCLVLINNLLQNAIRYNIDQGSIELLISHNKIIIANTSNNPKIDTLLFERFKKDSNSNQSLGLGLSIIKEIVDASRLSFDYNYSFNKHYFEISIDKNKIID